MTEKSAAEQLAEIQGNIAIATATSIAALTAALAEQPNVDGQKLIQDMFNFLPKKAESEPMQELLYSMIEKFLTGEPENSGGQL